MVLYYYCSLFDKHSYIFLLYDVFIYLLKYISYRERRNQMSKLCY